MTITVVVVGHTSREHDAHALAEQTLASRLFIDDGTLGCEGNHARAWDWHAATTPNGWAVVLEDDALPVNNFGDQLSSALAVAPAPIVSLYLGTGYPKGWQPRIRNAIDTIGSANWLIANTTIHAVGLAIHTDLLPLKLDQRVAIDAAIGNWAKRNNHLVAYTWPSLIDHADGPTLVTTRHSSNASRDQPRKAWRTGTRDHWTSAGVPLQ